MKTFTMWQGDLLAWYVFAAYWAITFLGVKPTKTSEKIADRLQTIVPMVVAFELLFSDVLGIGPLRLRFLPSRPWISLMGICLTYIGVALAVWARFCLGRYWSARVTLKEDHRLIRSGPYAYVRHPIYTGMLVAATGTALVMGEWRGVLAVSLILVAHTRKAAREEALLTTEFGAEYSQYRRRTGGLFPRVSRADQ
jgi:protein-S-isoprenylcysteine O-methyltransferase Ste14